MRVPESGVAKIVAGIRECQIQYYAIKKDYGNQTLPDSIWEAVRLHEARIATAHKEKVERQQREEKLKAEREEERERERLRDLEIKRQAEQLERQRKEDEARAIKIELAKRQEKERREREMGRQGRDGRQDGRNREGGRTVEAEMKKFITPRPDLRALPTMDDIVPARNDVGLHALLIQRVNVRYNSAVKLALHFSRYGDVASILTCHKTQRAVVQFTQATHCTAAIQHPAPPLIPPHALLTHARGNADVEASVAEHFQGRKRAREEDEDESGESVPGSSPPVAQIDTAKLRQIDNTVTQLSTMQTRLTKDRGTMVNTLSGVQDEAQAEKIRAGVAKIRAGVAKVDRSLAVIAAQLIKLTTARNTMIAAASTVRRPPTVKRVPVDSSRLHYYTLAQYPQSWLNNPEAVAHHFGKGGDLLSEGNGSIHLGEGSKSLVTHVGYGPQLESGTLPTLYVRFKDKTSFLQCSEQGHPSSTAEGIRLVYYAVRGPLNEAIAVTAVCKAETEAEAEGEGEGEGEHEAEEAEAPIQFTNVVNETA
ncbi:hypothetical protein KIPB_002272 [Kipferlia bialata]|uniref:Uncharacterized protein n=1 Tax=Kipferlia bialata TaxID=797122 RepID=A0A9K3GEU1_9EUKA|nr:hypothetical protein KIPB_002272 [Kipferlia bialata]|eukprot:g2272.t1